jgi:hypothetical protein
MKKQKEYTSLAQDKGLAFARCELNRNRPDDRHRQIMSLYSELLEHPHHEMSTVIVDESHDAKNEETQLCQGIKGLRYKTAFLLTGTPVFNTYRDYPAQCSLLPGRGPFEDTAHYDALFSLKDGQGRVQNKPLIQIDQNTVPQLRDLLQGLVFARPSTLLPMPAPHYHEVHVLLDDYPWIVNLVSLEVKVANSILSSRSPTDRNERDSRDTASGFSHLTRAQQLVASPVLAEGISEEDEMTKVLANFARDCDLPRNVAVHQLTAPQLDSFLQYWQKGRSGSTVENRQSTEDALIDLTIDEDLMTLAATAEEGEGEAKGNSRGPRSRGCRSDAKFACEWLEHIRKLPTERLHSPKILAILNCVSNIRREFQGDKIVIVSRYVMFLDLIKVVLQRQMPEVRVAEYNGTFSYQDRTSIINTFNKCGSGPTIMLLSTECGGTGLNITGANHMILSEPC